MHPVTASYRELYQKEKEEKGHVRDLAYILGISVRTAQRWNQFGIPEEKSMFDPSRYADALKGVPKREKQISLVDRDFQAEHQKLGTKALAQKYGVHQRTIQRWVKEGIPLGKKGTKYKGPSRRAPAVKRPYQPKIIHGVAHFRMKKFGADWYESTKLLVDTRGNRFRTEQSLDALIATEMNKGLYEGDIELLEHGIEPVNVTLSSEVLDTVLRRG